MFHSREIWNIYWPAICFRASAGLFWSRWCWRSTATGGSLRTVEAAKCCDVFRNVASRSSFLVTNIANLKKPQWETGGKQPGRLQSAVITILSQFVIEIVIIRSDHCDHKVWSLQISYFSDHTVDDCWCCDTLLPSPPYICNPMLCCCVCLSLTHTMQTYVTRALCMIFVLKSNPMLRRAACRDQTAVSCPSNVSNVYNSYNVVTIVQCLQLVQCRAMFAMFTTRTHSLFRCWGYIHMLYTYAFLQCCNAKSATSAASAAYPHTTQWMPRPWRTR